MQKSRCGREQDSNVHMAKQDAALLSWAAAAIPTAMATYEGDRN